jgi:hypothetical protein
MGLLDIFNSLTGDNAAAHFDQVAGHATASELGSGLADAMRSNQTPPFGDIVGQMFGNSNPNQQAGVLNQILATLGPAVMSGAAGGILGRIMQPGQQQITPDQASQITPAQAAEIAAHAEQAHPGVIDEVGKFYAEHSGLIKMLGGAALALTVANMKQNATNG